MKKSGMKVGTLLYHLKHGVVRVAAIKNRKNEAGEKVVFYTLTPFHAGTGKVRFMAPMAALKNSGFHELATEDEGNEVLRYFKKGIVSASLFAGVSKAGSLASQTSSLGDLARSLLSFAFGSFDQKDRANKLKLEEAAKGLTEELSYSFNTTQTEMAQKVKESLGSANMNPLVLATLESL